MANQLWHTDSTFLPVPALANILAARVPSSRGGETELVSTRAAWRDLPESLKARARNAVLRHRYAHSRAKISAALAKEETFTKWPDQAWKAVWRNPVTGEEALYLASHAFAVEGLPEAEGAKAHRRADRHPCRQRLHPRRPFVLDQHVAQPPGGSVCDRVGNR